MKTWLAMVGVEELACSDLKPNKSLWDDLEHCDGQADRLFILVIILVVIRTLRIFCFYGNVTI